MARLAIAAVVLALLHLLLHRRLVRATRLRAPWARVADLFLVVGWALAVAGVAVGVVIPAGWTRVFGFPGWTWLAVVFYLILGLAILGIVLLLMRVVGRFAGRPGAQDRLRFVRVGSAVTVIAAVATTLYGVSEAAAPRVTRQTMAVSGLPPAFSGLRVAVVSDLHLGPARGAGFTRTVVDAVNAQRPDVIVILGDLADGTVSRVSADLAPLADLSAPLGVFGVAGNHEEISDDVGAWMRYWRTLGITTLDNQRVEVRRGASVIDIAGVYDYTASAPYEPDLAAALDGRPDGRFVLLLAHQPNQVTEAAAAGVNLQLSGHTHGGQIWPLRHVAQWAATPAVTGADTVGGTSIFTTYGAGAWGPPVRVAAPPEIPILTLVPREPSA